MIKILFVCHGTTCHDMRKPLVNKGFLRLQPSKKPTFYQHSDIFLGNEIWQTYQYRAICMISVIDYYAIIKVQVLHQKEVHK